MTKNLTTKLAIAMCAGGLIGAATIAAGPVENAVVAAGVMGVGDVKVGDQAPDFSLVDTAGTTHKLSDYTKQGKIVVLEWFNPGCPFIVKNHETFTTMSDTYAAFKDKDVVWFAVNSAAPGKQGGGKELNAKMKSQWKIDYPILLDETGATGKAFGAKTTPHMFVIGKDGAVAYRGAIDNAPTPNKQGDVNYVKDALNSLIAGETISKPDTKPYGCSVKY